jgi:glyoxylase-like metal-dependent hydrolase (beta-lactamase superfamily II)
MEPVAITANIYQVPLRIVNVFLLCSDNGLTLIDTGPRGSKIAIFNAVKKIGYQPYDIKQIVVTHSHYDHAGGLAEILDAVRAPVFMHPLDAQLVGEGVAYQFRSGMLNAAFNLFTFNGRIRIPNIHVTPVKNIIPVSDGEWIGSREGLKVIYAPGHWPGQIALFHPLHRGILFAADIAENHGHLKISPQNHDLNASMDTLNKILSLPFDIAVFGHGQPILAGAAVIFKEVFGFGR